MKQTSDCAGGVCSTWVLRDNGLDNVDRLDLEQQPATSWQTCDPSPWNQTAPVARMKAVVLSLGDMKWTFFPFILLRCFTPPHNTAGMVLRAPVCGMWLTCADAGQVCHLICKTGSGKQGFFQAWALKCYCL